MPSNVLLQEASVEAAQAEIELTKNLQQLVVSRELLKDFEEKVAGSEAVRGNPDSTHSANIIEIESGTSTSTSTSTSDSSDLDDVPLNKLYKSLSPSTKQKQKANDEPYESLYPYVLDRIGAMSQMRVDIYAKLPADRPLQPPVVKPLNVAPADAEGTDEPAGSVSATTSTSSHSNHPTIVEPINFSHSETETIVEPSNPQPKSPTKHSEPNVLDQLVSHYSGELPKVESELQKAPNNKHMNHKQPQPQLKSFLTILSLYQLLNKLVK